jgi:hypothetical protein
MMTGVYDSAAFEADELAEKAYPFYFSELHAKRIAFSCRDYQRKSPPGAVWVYRSTDYYVLGVALQEFVRRHAGRDKDFYKDIVAGGIWSRLRLSPVVMTTLRTYDDVRQPFTGYGLTYHRDDIIRIARFLSLDNGRIGGESVLDPSLLSRALGRDAAHPGVATGVPQVAYAESVWTRDLGLALKCTRPVIAPFLAGYGGNSVVMLPNGIQFYYFGDGNVWNWVPAAVEINKIRPMCQ